MASLPEVTATLARATGIPADDIAYRARLLREAGLLPESRRGKGATHYRPRDAALLLVALLATDTPSKTATDTQTYASLRQSLVHIHGCYTNTTNRDLPRRLRAVTFLDALTAIVEAARSAEERVTMGDLISAIQVKRYAPMPTATIDFLVPDAAEASKGFPFSLVFLQKGAVVGEVNAAALGHKKTEWQPPAPIQTTVAIGGKVFLALGEVLGEAHGRSGSLITDPRQWAALRKAA